MPYHCRGAVIRRKVYEAALPSFNRVPCGDGVADILAVPLQDPQQVRGFLVPEFPCGTLWPRRGEVVAKLIAKGVERFGLGLVNPPSGRSYVINSTVHLRSCQMPFSSGCILNADCRIIHCHDKNRRPIFESRRKRMKNRIAGPSATARAGYDHASLHDLRHCGLRATEMPSGGGVHPTPERDALAWAGLAVRSIGKSLRR